MIMNVLTVDVEEYYHAAIFRRGAARRPRPAFESRVEDSMEQLLALLKRAPEQGHVLRARRGRRGASGARSAHRGGAARVACHGDRHEDV